VDGRAVRGPRRAVWVTRQSARGTWAPARLRWVLAAQGARQFAECALGWGAAWSSRLAWGRRGGGRPRQRFLGHSYDFGHTQVGQLAGLGLTHPNLLDTPKLASWRDWV
jgi:hypothetical protein